MERYFDRLASWASDMLGRGIACVIAILLVVLGFAFLPVEAVNVAISVATLVLLFVLQASSNKDSRAAHLKLDELVRELNEPRSEIAQAERRPLDELENLDS